LFLFLRSSFFVPLSSLSFLLSGSSLRSERFCQERAGRAERSERADKRKDKEERRKKNEERRTKKAERRRKKAERRKMEWHEFELHSRWGRRVWAWMDVDGRGGTWVDVDECGWVCFGRVWEFGFCRA
jgi:hypothetical protein